MIVVDILSEGDRPPAASPMRVQVLDTTYADAPSRVIAEEEASVEPDAGSTLGRVALDADLPPGGDYRVRVHVDVDGDGAVSSGDFVTTEAYPAVHDEPVRVTVRRV